MQLLGFARKQIGHFKLSNNLRRLSRRKADANNLISNCLCWPDPRK